ncbi:hypothetical protein [Algibacter sp. PT7-4]|uniref:hypothetical protein n=1 Tax=Algibacter ulvanivorans TaxID=3400999 RepID=UPI003AAC8885
MALTDQQLQTLINNTAEAIYNAQTYLQACKDESVFFEIQYTLTSVDGSEITKTALLNNLEMQSIKQLKPIDVPPPIGNPQ